MQESILCQTGKVEARRSTWERVVNIKVGFEDGVLALGSGTEAC